MRRLDASAEIEMRPGKPPSDEKLTYLLNQADSIESSALTVFDLVVLLICIPCFLFLILVIRSSLDL